jgi:hypothetical protein
VFLFSVCFVLFAVLYLLDPSIHVWERDTLHFFSLEYSCASLILVEYSCLVAVIAVSSQFFIHLLLELSVSFEESTLLLHLYLFGELSNKLIGVWLDQKNAMHVVVV